METQVEKVIAPESVHTAVPTVMVTGIFDSQSGSGKNVQLKWLTEKPGTNSVTSFLLGKLAKPNVEKRTALVFLESDVFTMLGLEIGSNFNEAMAKHGQPASRLSISEISDAEYQLAKEANENSVFGYQQKINPSTGEVMGLGGAPIWRKTFRDDVDGADQYLQSDGSTVVISEGDITV